MRSRKSCVKPGIEYRSPSASWRLLAIALYLMLDSIATFDAHADQKADSRDRQDPIVYVGVREDAKPFSYRATDAATESILTGFGGFTIDVCRHVLKMMQLSPEYQNLEFRAWTAEASNRFEELSKDGHLLMLCGPDSITEKRLADFHVSHPVFESGMTYAYLNPRSPLFPRGGHCKGIVGVVRGTTADLHGLGDIAGRDILMRFDSALDLELNMTHEKLLSADEKMIELVKAQHEYIQERIDAYAKDHVETNNELQSDVQDLRELDDLLNDSDPNRIHGEIRQLTNTRLTAKLQSQLHAAYRHINESLASKIVTDECPVGFTSLPIRKYPNHNEGVEGLCSGEVLYYLGDYDIISSKVDEFSGCDVVMNRFTRSKEVYGVFFSKQAHYVTKQSFAQDDVQADHLSAECKDPLAEDCRPEVTIDVADFYTTFNNLLLRSMQGRSSAIEAIFEEEFVEREKSAELKAFFETFKVSSYEE